MRNIQHMLSGLFVMGAAVVGCNGAMGPGEGVGSSEARIAISTTGSGTATLHLTATDDASASVAIDKSVSVKAGSTTVLDLGVSPASYTFHADLYADAAQTKLIGSGSLQADLSAGGVTEINLSANASGDVSASASAGGSGGVTLGANAAPKIGNIDVQVNAGGELDLSGADASVTINVDASDPEGGKLLYFWSGLGLDSALQGSSSITISGANAIKFGADRSVHLVVQDTAGATAAASISFTAKAGAILSGGFDVSTDASVEVQACIDARAQCTATCDAAAAANAQGASAQGTCVAQCGLDLATCDTKAALAK